MSSVLTSQEASEASKSRSCPHFTDQKVEAPRALCKDLLLGDVELGPETAFHSSSKPTVCFAGFDECEAGTQSCMEAAGRGRTQGQRRDLTGQQGLPGASESRAARARALPVGVVFLTAVDSWLLALGQAQQGEMCRPSPPSAGLPLPCPLDAVTVPCNHHHCLFPERFLEP